MTPELLDLLTKSLAFLLIVGGLTYSAYKIYCGLKWLRDRNK